MLRAARMSDAARRAAAWAATPVGLATLFALGLGLRLILAGGGGFPFDMTSFSGWSSRLTEVGPWSFYPRGDETYFIDYPPGYLYVLYVLGWIGQLAGSSAPPVYLLKIPPILADLVLAWLVSLLAERLAPPSIRRAVPLRGVAAAAVLFNPAIFFISAVWGQADSVAAAMVAGGFLLLVSGKQTLRREAAAMALLAVAVGTKPQTAMVLPAVALVMVWRHLGPGRPARTGWRPGAVRFSALLGAGALAGFALLAPFRLWPIQAYEFYAGAAGTYEVTSVFAFNLWGAVGFWRADIGSEAFTVLGVPAMWIGLAAFAIGLGATLGRGWRALGDGVRDSRVLVVAALATTLLGFAVLTRIHERYLFVSLALLLAFVSARKLALAAGALTVLYLGNVYFPYVYYLEFVERPAPRLGPVFEALYGSDINGVRMKLWALATGVVCLVIAWKAWTWMTERPRRRRPVIEAAAAPEPAGPFTLSLHRIGRPGLILVLAAFIVALGSRLAGLGHPPGMYFDEVYHARTGAEYLAGVEVYEWTHPPLAKEIIGAGIDHLSGFGTTSGPILSTVDREVITGGSGVIVWSDERGAIRRGHLTGRCGLVSDALITQTDLRPTAIAISDDGSVFVGGDDADGSVVIRIDNGAEAWRAKLSAPVRELAAVGDGAAAITREGSLVVIDGEGIGEEVAIGAGHVSGDGSLAWVSFPEDGRIASWDLEGNRDAVIEIDGEPLAVAAVPGAQRVAVAAVDGDTVWVVDTAAGTVQATLDRDADHLTHVPETGLVYAASDDRATVVEPRGATAIASVRLSDDPSALFADPAQHRAVAVTEQGLTCVEGKPALAWRLGSAVFGAAIVALVALLALRLFGNLWIAGLAALFVAVDGLAFTLSRIAMNDSYVVAFILLAWFGVLSAFRSLDAHRRWATVGWLAVGGVAVGAAAASKWVGVYTLAGLALLFVWDITTRGREGMMRLAGGPVRSVAVLAVLFVAVPVGVYVASYVPFFGLGNSFGDLVQLQRNMFGYHANLDATHPFGAPWYGWPVGYRAVFLYLADGAGTRAEIWTIPNLVVWLGGLAALAAVARRAWSSRSLALGVVVIGAVVQFLPWMAISRVTFLYHYAPVVPFLALALAWYVREGSAGGRLGRIARRAVPVAAVVFFLAVLPMLEGWHVPVGYLEGVRSVLPWVIP